MLNQIKNFPRTSPPGQHLADLNDKNEIMYVGSQELLQRGREAYQIGRRIVQKVIEEKDASPNVINLIKRKLERYADSQLLMGADIIWLQTMIVAMETKSYAPRIVTCVHNPGGYEYKSLIKHFGADLVKEYDAQSPKYNAIIDLLDKMDVDLASDFAESIRYINAVILDNFEKEVLEKIDPSVKSNPTLFITTLRQIQESNLHNHYVMQKLIAQAEVWQVMKANPKLNEFPFEDIWCFCIDFEFQKFGAYIFENEPGYMVASLNALKFSLECKNPTYLDYIEINKKCGENVHKDLYSWIDAADGGDSEFLETILREISVFFQIPYIDEEGFKDLKERSANSSFFQLLSNFSNATIGKGPFKIQSKGISREQNISKMQFLFEYHQQQISQAKNKAQRLIAHLWLARELELHHHFVDGNGRSSDKILLSLLANDPELPMILYNSDLNYMDGNGPIGFVQRILSAMHHFNKTCGHEEIPLTFLQIDEMTNISQKPSWRHYHPSDVV